MTLSKFFTLAAMLVFSVSAVASADTIKVSINGSGSISGESIDKSKSIEFTATGFKFSVSEANNSGAGAGAGSGRVTFNPFSIMKALDATSPVLFQAAVNGTAFPSATITFSKPNGRGAVTAYYKITLSNVLISGLNDGDYKDGSPVESLSLSYERVQVEDLTSDTIGSGSVSAP